MVDSRELNSRAELQMVVSAMGIQRQITDSYSVGKTFIIITTWSTTIAIIIIIIIPVNYHYSS